MKVARVFSSNSAFNQTCNDVLAFLPLGLHELDAINDQEVKDFRSKMFRMSEERMQRVQMMTYTEWLQACFSPQLEPTAGTAITDGLNDRPADLKVIIHFDQSQVRVLSPVWQMLESKSQVKYEYFSVVSPWFYYRLQ